MQHYSPIYTVIQKLPFWSGFNTGVGEKYFLNGTTVSSNSWNSLGIQDYLPTWQFKNETTGSNALNAAYDYTDAYNGGSNLNISGTVSKASSSTFPLFATQLDLTDAAKDLSVNLKYKLTSDNKVKTYLVLDLENDKSKAKQVRILLSPTPHSPTTWSNLDSSLAAFSSETIKKISVSVVSPSTSPVKVQYNLKMGHLFIGESQAFKTVASPEKPTYNKKFQLTWNYKKLSDDIYFNIYANSEFVGRTYQQIFQLSSTDTNIKVSASNALGVESVKVSPKNHP